MNTFDKLPSDLARPRQLVSCARLAARLPPGACLLEVGCGAAASFERGHIPGAHYLDTASLEAPPLFNKVPDDLLLRVLLEHGIAHDTTVILYGRGSLAAARAAHLMLYAGVLDVRLLDGGFTAWRAQGLPEEIGPALTPRPIREFGARFPSRPEFLADTRRAKALLARPDAALASIRPWSEFSGATSGYSYIDARGEIAGARWGRAGREGDVNCMSEFQRADGRMRPVAEIARMWQSEGIVRERHVAFYCGTGWRASLAFFYAWLMGWEQISVYDGGWYEWSGDPGNSVVCRAAEALSA